MKVKCVIIDDEPNVRELIKNIILDNFSTIEIVGTANSVLSGLREINEKKPQIVLLDIELPDGTGFDILENISDLDIKVVFITAFNDYAIKAFKFSAVDYILKPINIIEFIKSVNKTVSTIEKHNNYNVLIENIISECPSKLAIQVANGIEYVDVNNIVSINGEGRYSTIYFLDGKKHIESKVLSYFEDILCQSKFLRIHRSNIINLNHVKAFTSTDGGKVKMIDDSSYSISRSKKVEFLQKMDEL